MSRYPGWTEEALQRQEQRKAGTPVAYMQELPITILEDAVEARFPARQIVGCDNGGIAFPVERLAVFAGTFTHQIEQGNAAVCKGWRVLYLAPMRIWNGLEGALMQIATALDAA